MSKETREFRGRNLHMSHAVLWLLARDLAEAEALLATEPLVVSAGVLLRATLVALAPPRPEVLEVPVEVQPVGVSLVRWCQAS